jgi:4'-phosphopantetheinyl transferase EntD
MIKLLPEKCSLRAWAERRNILVGARKIAPGDEAVLSLEEAASLGSSRTELRRASGAARVVARDALTRLGAPSSALVKDADGAPLWPSGYVGSLAHDATYALAAVAREKDVWALGADLEPDLPMAEEMVELVATPAERGRYDADLLRSAVLFVVKEAVFKAVFPREKCFLDYHDIEVDLHAGRARTRYGAIAEFIWARERQICALAAINAAR